MKTAAMCLTLAVVVAGLCGPAPADPLPGQVIKFAQQPMVATPVVIPGEVIMHATYFGHDEKSQANYVGNVNGWDGYSGNAWMADDFADQLDQDVVHVRWWGSYIGQQPPPAAGGHINKFLIEFLSDQPGPAGGGYSRPLAPLLSQVVDKGLLTPGSGTFTESMIRTPDPLLGEGLYEYNAELKLPFAQQAHTVYWLKIVALDDQPAENYTWGWHNRDYTKFDPLACGPLTCGLVLPGERVVGLLPDGQPIWHFQDDAVQGSSIHVWLPPTGGMGMEVTEDLLGAQPKNYLAPFDGPSLIELQSKDLAFQLFAVPEPTTLALLGLGGLSAVALRVRRSRFHRG